MRHCRNRLNRKEKLSQKDCTQRHFFLSQFWVVLKTFLCPQVTFTTFISPELFGLLWSRPIQYTTVNAILFCGKEIGDIYTVSLCQFISLHLAKTCCSRVIYFGLNSLCSYIMTIKAFCFSGLLQS